MSSSGTEGLPGPGAGEGAAGLYVHIPFCRTKCPYCSFTSFPGVSEAEATGYLAALQQQAAVMADHPWVRAQQFSTMFIGGGTPTSLESDGLAELIKCCLARYPFVQERPGGPEVSLETNPNTVTYEKLARLRQAGANRLSIGVQSFADHLLAAIGRSHSSDDAVRAVALARRAGFANINLDLMYGLPGQSLAEWRQTLETALALQPQHLALYELTIEADTVFAERASQGNLDLPGEEEALAMEEATAELLGEAGFARYEISNYARPGYACGHNSNYWENSSYLGLGAGAVSCFSGVRVRNVAEPAAFIRLVTAGLPPFFEAECLDHATRFRESVIMGLRMTKGVSTAQLEARFGLSLEAYYGAVLQELLAGGWLAMYEGRLRLTEKGRPVANSVLSELV